MLSIHKWVKGRTINDLGGGLGQKQEKKLNGYSPGEKKLNNLEENNSQEAFPWKK